MTIHEPKRPGHARGWLFLAPLAALALAACASNAVTPAVPPTTGSSGAGVTATGASPNPNAPATMMASPSTDFSNYAPADGVNLWPAPRDVASAIKAAGLESLPQEGFSVHIHPHLDVWKDGQHIIVPAMIGIDPQGRFISPLHTHVNSGVMHIESPKSITLKLGMIFQEWGVPLDGAKAWVNGQAAANPADIVLSDHAENVVVFGTPPASIPATWTPPTGDWF